MINRTLVVFIAKIILFFLVFLAGYYLLFLRPALVLPEAFIAVEKSVTGHQFNLLQNRLALTEMAKLDPKLANFINGKGRLLETLKKTNKEGLKAVDEQGPPPKIAGAPNEFTNFLNKDFASAFPILLEKNKSILKKQQTLISRLTDLDSETSNIFLYNPAQDLGSLDLIIDRDKVVKRAGETEKGIGNISEGLNNLDLKLSEVTNLQIKIEKTQEYLDVLISQTEKGNRQEASSARTEVIDQFIDLKVLASTAQLALIKSDEAVKLITRETNLILEYDFWLKKINDEQDKLSTKN